MQTQYKYTVKEFKDEFTDPSYLEFLNHFNDCDLVYDEESLIDDDFKGIPINNFADSFDTLLHDTSVRIHKEVTNHNHYYSIMDFEGILIGMFQFGFGDILYVFEPKLLLKLRSM